MVPEETRIIKSDLNRSRTLKVCVCFGGGGGGELLESTGIISPFPVTEIAF